MLLVCCVLFTSCQLFTSTEDKTKELVQQEMQNIDWNSVDTYPLFEECDETQDQQAQQLCFKETLHQYLSEPLSQTSFSTAATVIDTLYVYVMINADGSLMITSLEADTVLEKLPEIEQLITKAVAQVPRVQPALKRGVPVRTQFKLPIAIHTK